MFRAKPWWSGHRAAWTQVALLVAGSLVVQLGVTTTALATPHPAAVTAPKANLGDPVPVTEIKPKTQARPKSPATYKATAAHWPAPITGTVPLTGNKPRTAGNPVWAQAISGAKAAYAGPSALGVKVASHGAATAVGVTGILAQVTPTGTGRGPVRLSVDYSSFAQAYGGDYASRLHLVTLPSCALTTPQFAACRVQTPLASANDAAARSLSATVTLGTAPRGVAKSLDLVGVLVRRCPGGPAVG